MKRIKILSAVFAAVVVINTIFTAVIAKDSTFELIGSDKSDTLGGTVYYYRHKKTGAEVVYNDNNSDKLEFVIGFKTPPVDSKGANHVLEHALFCGSEKYPIKNIMHYIQNGTSSLILNGVTSDDCTYYLINSENKNEFYNMIDVYMNGIFHPLFLTDKNIFRQQGIRVEYADGKARYNGVVYNELRIKNLNTEENSVNFLADKLYKAIYGDTTPAFSAGGELDEIKKLTYEDLLRVYNTYYIPSNSMTYIAGNQDIDKTFEVLDCFFSDNTAEAPDITFADTKMIPADYIREYNIDGNTKTVDIGFMSSGVPASAGANERYARDILFDIIQKKLEKETGCTEMYTSGGNSGGIANLAMLISNVPIERKDEIISAYNTVLESFETDGIDENDIDIYIEQQKKNFYVNWDNIFNGLLYKGNPLAYTEINAACEYLKNHKEYFSDILKKYFTDNPYSTVIVSGNGMFASEDSSVQVSDEKLFEIKRVTEEFQRWNDAEDRPEIIDKIPFLTLDEVKMPPVKSQSEYEEQNGISFYYTEKDDSSADLYFPLDIKDEDMDYVQLMHYFLQFQAKKAKLDFYTMLTPLANAANTEELNPHFMIGILGENAADTLEKTAAFLQSEDTWDENDLAEYIRKTPSEILDSYYDPYWLSSELKGSALSAEGRFSYLIPLNTIVKGSSHYFHFLKNINTEDISEILQRIKTLAQNIIVDSRPVVGYIGTGDNYNKFKNTVTKLFADKQEHKSSKLRLPIGCYSAATITKLADANHFMLAGSYGEKEYSGKMAVLGRVLSTKYITPTMRGKHGAYGCGISFREEEMVSSVAGLADVDLAIDIWNGMGDYLRTMNMTQKELDAFIVSAVMEYDEWDYKASEYGASFALKKKSADTCEKIRNEMLSATVEDIKEYADFVDDLVSQKRVFAVLGKSAADNAKFDFAYYGNADTLEVTPRLKKNPEAYIYGKTDSTFAPDDYITRAEVAALIDRVISDRRKAQNISAFADVDEDAWFCNAVESLYEKDVINGDEVGYYRPDDYITRAELSVVLSRFIYEPKVCSDVQYSDINEDDWFYEPMCKLINSGYITGYNDNTIRPDKEVTRAEMTAIMNRMLNLTCSENKNNPFNDVDTSHWAYKYILAAAI